MTILKQRHMTTEPSQCHDALTDDDLSLIVGGNTATRRRVMTGRRSQIFDWYGEDFHRGGDQGLDDIFSARA